MAQSNKNTPNPTIERASAPETRASVTIEAAVGIPLFLLAAVCLIWLIEIQSIELSILNAAQGAAKKASVQTAVVPVLNSIKFRSDLIKLIGEERIERSIIDGGCSGISCVRSYISAYTGEMNITVDYRIRIPEVRRSENRKNSGSAHGQGMKTGALMRKTGKSSISRKTAWYTMRIISAPICSFQSVLSPILNFQVFGTGTAVSITDVKNVFWERR